jgi:hypothetical protein
MLKKDVRMNTGMENRMMTEEGSRAEWRRLLIKNNARKAKKWSRPSEPQTAATISPTRRRSKNGEEDVKV